MISNYHCRLFLLTLTLIYLLFIPMINCTNNQIKETTIDEQFPSPIIKNPFYNLFKRKQFEINSDEDEQMKYFIENYLKNSPYRRALSFHAMRGK